MGERKRGSGNYRKEGNGVLLEGEKEAWWEEELGAGIGVVRSLEEDFLLVGCFDGIAFNLESCVFCRKYITT